MTMKDALTILTLPSPTAEGMGVMTAIQPSPSLRGSKITSPLWDVISPAHGRAGTYTSTE